jgi:hypothetical protein
MEEDPANDENEGNESHSRENENNDSDGNERPPSEGYENATENNEKDEPDNQNEGTERPPSEENQIETNDYEVDEEIENQTKSQASLINEEIKSVIDTETEETIPDEAPVVVEHSSKKESEDVDLPPVEEDLIATYEGSMNHGLEEVPSTGRIETPKVEEDADIMEDPDLLTNKDDLEQDLYNIDEFHGDPVPDVAVEEKNLNQADNNDLPDDPFLIVGRKLSSNSSSNLKIPADITVNSSNSSSLLKGADSTIDTLNYSMSTVQSTKQAMTDKENFDNTNNTSNNNNNDDDDSLFKDVEKEMSVPSKKERIQKSASNDDEKKVSPRAAALAKLKRKSSKNVDKVEIPETAAPEEKEKEPEKIPTSPDAKNNPWEAKPKSSKKIPAKAGIAQQQHPSAEGNNDLSMQDKISQAEQAALRDKQERMEKLNLKKFKRNAEKLQKEQQQQQQQQQPHSDREDPLVKGKKSQRGGNNSNKEQGHETDDNASVSKTEQHKNRIPRRKSKDEKLPSARDGETAVPTNNEENEKNPKLPAIANKQLPRKPVPKEKKESLPDPQQPANNQEDSPFFLPEISPTKKPIKFPAKSKYANNLRSQVRASKHEVTESADDSSILSQDEIKKHEEKKKLSKMPHSSPSDRHPSEEQHDGAMADHEDDDDASTVRRNGGKKLKPLYLRMIEKAEKKIKKEEKMKVRLPFCFIIIYSLFICSLFLFHFFL